MLSRLFLSPRGCGFPAQSSGSTAGQVHYRFETVGDVEILYREAGDPAAPTVLLLHGFTASSYMWRDVIEALADGYHVLAPDFPAFGGGSPIKNHRDHFSKRQCL